MEGGTVMVIEAWLPDEENDMYFLAEKIWL
jgi:hypothetical protein